MSLITKKQVVINEKWAIAEGFSYKSVGAIQFKKDLTKEEKQAIKKRKELRFLDAGRFKNNEVLDKTIHSYRMWFRFLKLALYLEEQNTTLIMKHKTTKNQLILVMGIRDWQKVQHKEIVKKIKVKRSKYKGWDLDEVRDKTFNEWWNTHSHLFSEQICKELDERDAISVDKKHLTLQIDTTLKLTDILKTVGRIVKERRKANKGMVFAKQRQYSVNGSVHKDALINKYNCLVLKLENKLSNEGILTHSKGYIRTEYKVSRNIDYNKRWSRVVYGLLDSNGESLGAKQLLTNVCEGIFMHKDDIVKERKWTTGRDLDGINPFKKKK